VTSSEKWAASLGITGETAGSPGATAHGHAARLPQHSSATEAGRKGIGYIEAEAPTPKEFGLQRGRDARMVRS